MKRINKSIGLLLAAFLLSACATNDKEDDFKPDQDQTPPVENSENEAENSKEEEIEVADLRDFFCLMTRKLNMKALAMNLQN